MSEYISREAIITWIEKSLAMYHDKYSTDMLHMFGLFRSVIEDKSLFPSADVEERKTGKWIEREDMYYGWNIWECSNCHEEFCVEEGSPNDNEYHYCPNCGARMVSDD